MSSDNGISRRGFIAVAAAAGGALALVAKQVGTIAKAAPVEEAAASVDTTSVGEPQLFLFDGDNSATCRAVSCATLAITGDRVRFARGLFPAGGAPEIIGGVSTYADFILLTGCAEEHGYRVIETRATGTLVEWKIVRPRRATSFG